MGNKARRIRSNKFAKKFAALRAKASARLGVLKEEVKEALAPEPKEELVIEKVEKVQAAPAKPAAPKKKAPSKRKKKSDDA